MHRLILTLLFSVQVICFGQIENYTYKQKIKGVEGEWQKIILPQDLVAKLKSDMSDLRVIGIDNNDTLEMPFLMRGQRTQKAIRYKSFPLINKSSQGNRHFMTFHVKDDIILDHLELKVEDQNYDWYLTVEASNDQKEWFVLADQQRILDISNSTVDFEHNVIQFPKSNYKYYRVSFISNRNPNIDRVFITNTIAKNSEEEIINNLAWRQFDKSESKSTTLNVSFNEARRVNAFQIEVSDSIDFYRPIHIYAIDTIQTSTGKHSKRRLLKSSILHSSQENYYIIPEQKLNELEVEIYNFDNQPLTVKKISAFGIKHEFDFRASDSNLKYFLVYGNEDANTPNYDLIHFKDKLPDQINAVSLSNPIKLMDDIEVKERHLLDNKLLLWTILVSITLLLAWFSIKMLRSL